MKEPIALEKWKPLAKPPKPLQRVHRVHCTLEGEMSVKAFEKHYCLIDNMCSFPCRQLFGLGKELVQSDAGPKKRPDGLMGLLEDSSRK
jgi:hypothetical protein